MTCRCKYLLFYSSLYCKFGEEASYYIPVYLGQKWLPVLIILCIRNTFVCLQQTTLQVFIVLHDFFLSYGNFTLVFSSGIFIHALKYTQVMHESHTLITYIIVCLGTCIVKMLPPYFTCELNVILLGGGGG